MRNVNCLLLSSLDNQNSASIAIDANQLVSASFHAYFGDITAAGTLKLQISNDTYNARYNYPEGTFVPTHWVDLPTQTTNITAGASALLTVANMTYRWIRAVYTSTATAAQTIMPVADVAGSLNSTYFLLQDANSANSYYVWIDVDSTGVDPMIAGRTGVPIAISADDSAATIGGVLATEIAALNGAASFSTSGTTTVTVTNLVAGPFVPMTDGADPTGFAFAITAGGSSTLTVNMNALSV